MITPLGQVTGELQDVREWTTFGNGSSLPAVSSTKKYTGGYAVRIGNISKAAGLTFAAQNDVRMGAWFNHVGLVNNGLGALFTLRAAGTVVAQVYMEQATGNVILETGGVTRQTKTATEIGLNANDTWMHIGLIYLASLGICTFFVDGIAQLTYSGVLAGSVNEAYCGGSRNSSFNYGWTNYSYIDDFYVEGGIETSEAPPSDRFLFSLASAAGASAQWTPTGQATNIACVDEAVPNDDTDYVLASAADLVDKYATANITVPTNYAIVAAIPIALAKVMAAGPTLKLVAADGVNSDLESAAKTPGTSYGYVWESMPLAPDGGAWDETKFNAAEFGIKSAGTF